jgi:hypothetical protein
MVKHNDYCKIVRGAEADRYMIYYYAPAGTKVATTYIGTATTLWAARRVAKRELESRRSTKSFVEVVK